MVRAVVQWFLYVESALASGIALDKQASRLEGMHNKDNARVSYLIQLTLIRLTVLE